MKAISATFALGACALTLASAGSAAVEFGANDDTGKYLADGSADYFGQMAAAGLTPERDDAEVGSEQHPMTIPDQAFLDGALPAAQAAGIKVVFALYGATPTTFTGDGGTAGAFAAWAGAGRAPPTRASRTFIVGNEPNQPRSGGPSSARGGAQASAAAFGPVLAAAYDALKAVDPAIQVVGVGPLSARQRPAGRAEQRLDVARSLPEGARRLVPLERPHDAGDGRAQLPPLPERERRTRCRGATCGRTRACRTSTGSSRRSTTRSRAPGSRP